VTKKIIIAIDGPVGSGKSTVARRVAELLGYTHLDSGAMYRAIALKAMRKGVSLDDAAAMTMLAALTRIELVPGENGARVRVDGEDVTAEIRSPEMSRAASQLAVLEGVRQPLVKLQQSMGTAGGVVMEGRDIGSVVFPQAELKVFLDASVEERARRRLAEHRERGVEMSYEQMVEEVRARDKRDTGREVSPLRRAEDAVYVDCTAMDAEEAARLIVMLARAKAEEPGTTQR
jgi:cytidylate kinase